VRGLFRPAGAADDPAAADRGSKPQWSVRHRRHRHRRRPFRPGGRGAPRHFQGADLLRTGASSRAQEGWLSYPRRPHGRAKEVRRAKGPPLVPVLEALGARERRGERKRAFGPAFLLRQCGRQIGCSRTRLEEDMPSKSIDHAFAARRITGAASDPTYAGAPSFMRRRYTKNVKGADVVVWGIPFDAAVSNRPGARFGPQAIRRASAIFDNDPQYPFGIDLFEQLAVIDYGDCLLDYGHPQRAPAAI